MASYGCEGVFLVLALDGGLHGDICRLAVSLLAFSRVAMLPTSLGVDLRVVTDWFYVITQL
jgi:hypothetical protein